MIRQGKQILVVLFLVVGMAVGSGGTAQSAAGTIDVRECVVYSVQNPAQRFDCLDRARELCDGKPLCELPIGLALSGGRDIDPKAAKKVKVLLSCGAHPFVQGPHDQDEHATMILLCLG
jgi:hypothetical protein